MATITNRGPHQWQATVRRSGFKTTTKTFLTKRDANDWASMVEAEMRRGVFIDRSEAERTTFRELLERYEREVTPGKRGAASERSRLRRLKDHLIANLRLAQLRSVDFASYRDERLNEGAAGKTVREELLLCSAVLNTAKKDWSIEVQNSVQTVRIPQAGAERKRRLAADEEERLLAACEQCKSPGLVEAVVLAIQTGMRRGEIAQMTWSQVDFAAKVVRLDTSKNGEGRVVPLTHEAEAALQRLRELPRNINGRVFSFHDSNGLGAAYRRACERAEIDDLRFHDLRHEAASRFAPHMPVASLAKVMGWKTIQMAMRYYNPKEAELVALVRRVG